jgi:hypothetical protein
MGGILPSYLFSTANVAGNDFLHTSLAVLSVAVLVVSVAAYAKRRDSRYLFLMIAFAFFALDQVVTLYQEVYCYGLLIVIPGIGLHLVHVLELLMLVSLLAALVLPMRGIKS